MSENQNPPADDARAKFLAALEKKKNKNLNLKIEKIIQNNKSHCLCYKPQNGIYPQPLFLQPPQQAFLDRISKDTRHDIVSKLFTIGNNRFLCPLVMVLRVRS